MKFAKAIPGRAPSRFVVAIKRHRVKLMTEVAQTTALWPVTLEELTGGIEIARSRLNRA
jgi:hypothetical protein